MSKLETPMIERYWSRIGGTLVLEFQAVPRTATTGRRLIDAVILPGLPTTKTHWSKVDLQGQDDPRQLLLPGRDNYCCRSRSS
jgi:hypothetical protein